MKHFTATEESGTPASLALIPRRPPGRLGALIGAVLLLSVTAGCSSWDSGTATAPTASPSHTAAPTVSPVDPTAPPAQPAQSEPTRPAPSRTRTQSPADPRVVDWAAVQTPLARQFPDVHGTRAVAYGDLDQDGVTEAIVVTKGGNGMTTALVQQEVYVYRAESGGRVVREATLLTIGERIAFDHGTFTVEGRTLIATGDQAVGESPDPVKPVTLRWTWSGDGYVRA